MRSSHLFTRTAKEANKAEVSRNAQLLTRAGYVHRLMAGVYQYLPLGLRVLNKIEDIIREEMDAIGGQEVLMPSLHPKENWEKTGRWGKVDVLYKLSGEKGALANDFDFALGPTHEETVTPLVGAYIQSYRDLPVAAYQIQTKFRNEPRPKSGLLRGREFRMKDMYSFHADQGDLDFFYDRATQAYVNVYNRCGVGDITLMTYAGGGIFSKYSHEFQTITPYGEDVIYRIAGSNVAINKEIMGDVEALRDIIPNYQPGDEKKLEELKAIEVGNIFKLGTRFSEAFDAHFTDKGGGRKMMIMGCYGLGPSRLMGAIAECLGDDNGLIWPDTVAPYKIGIINLKKGQEQTDRICEDLYAKLTKAGVETLNDDRDASAGVKFADMDLLGIPWHITVGPRGLEKNMVEIKRRSTGVREELSLDDAFAKLTKA